MCRSFFGDLDVGTCIFKEVPKDTFTLKAHRIDNNTVLTLPAQR